jgi:hypothetical protein
MKTETTTNISMVAISHVKMEAEPSHEMLCTRDDDHVNFQAVSCSYSNKLEAVISWEMSWMGLLRHVEFCCGIPLGLEKEI